MRGLHVYASQVIVLDVLFWKVPFCYRRVARTRTAIARLVVSQ
jgi:hypothetical protein